MSNSDKKSNVLSMAEFRQKKAAAAADGYYKIAPRPEDARDATDKEMAEFIAESVRDGAGDGYSVQTIGDLLYRNRLEGIAIDGIVYDSGRILSGLKEHGWVPVMPGLSPYDQIILGEMVRLKNSGLDIRAALGELASSERLKHLGITGENIIETIELIRDHFKLSGGEYEN